MAISSIVVSHVRVIDIGLSVGEQSKVQVEPNRCIEYIPIYM
jgi:hypothetical protein